MLLKFMQALLMLEFYFFNLELKLKDTESAIKNKLKKYGCIKKFKFVTSKFFLFTLKIRNNY